MTKKKALTIEQHVQNGIELHQLREHIIKATLFTNNGAIRPRPAVKALTKARNAIDEARSLLDSEYHTLATDDEFCMYGHVYYTGSEKNSATL